MPGHPPCALISLIFSSLDPETNWSTLYVRFFFLISKKVLITPLQLVFYLESFSVQLSRCRQLRCISFCFRFQNCFETVQFSLSRTLKTIQNLIFANATDFLFDAVRPFADPSFPSSAADFCQLCCPVTAPYWSTCFAFASLVNQIDL